MQVQAFHPDHLRGFEPHREVDRLLLGPLLVNPQYGVALANAGQAYSGLVDGQTIACVGIIDLDHNHDRGHVWALMTTAAGPYMTTVTRGVARFLVRVQTRRLETQIYMDWGPSRRWVELLGFRCEGVARQYTPDGKDAWLYARIKGDPCLVRH